MAESSSPSSAQNLTTLDADCSTHICLLIKPDLRPLSHSPGTESPGSYQAMPEGSLGRNPKELVNKTLGFLPDKTS